MADLGFQFDAESVDPMGDRSPVPAGKYRAIITKSEWKATKAGTGRYLEFVIQIVEGESNGRMLWARLNLENPNQTAVDIARKELSSICRATGKLKPRDTMELHDIPFIVDVAVKRREDTGDLSNEVKGYQSVRAASESRQAEPSAAGSSKPSWM